ncbi:MAG: asparagine synthase (glutamine-hydrolyzing), partial [Bacteroidetes bacterium]|nr:asparagine synthase (glutamine-hydrolyzing) [Bacteroidota bacterium]
MCGIAGIYSFQRISEKHQELTQNAVSRMGLRGPDTSGVLQCKNAILGHARLSIIDVSDAASQPFTDPTGRYSIVFNGEFFNFKKHRQALEQQGVTFRSESDTEVLLQLFIREKEQCLKHINGFFAFAVFDNETSELFVARDRFGIKPLVYHFNSERFVFASEMKALVEFEIPRIINHVSLAAYLHLNYIPQPATIFQDVFTLEPGTWLSIMPDGKTESGIYYDIPEHTSLELPYSYDDAKQKLIELLDAAVERRLISDVPLGAFLSGGIDSSVVTALASRHVGKLKTFSIGYKDEPFFDETHYAELVAKKFGTEHTVFKLSNDDLFEHLFQVLDYTDMPFADSSALAVYILSMHTRKHVTVALSGDGADEMFAGYNKHLAEHIVRTGGFKAGLSKTAAPMLKRFPQGRNSPLQNKIRQLVKFGEGAALSEQERYWQWAGFTQGNDVQRLLKSPPEPVAISENARKCTRWVASSPESFNMLLKNDMKLILQSDMLTKVDLMSMANSLEVRVPFLDHTVVDFVFSLPPQWKIYREMKKRILQDAFRDILPPELYNRP